MSLVDYLEAVPWAESIREQLVAQKMPPWYVDPTGPAVKGGHPLPTKELDILLDWAAGGTPRADEKTFIFGAMQGVTSPSYEGPPKQWSAGPPDLRLADDCRLHGSRRYDSKTNTRSRANRPEGARVGESGRPAAGRALDGARRDHLGRERPRARGVGARTPGDCDAEWHRLSAAGEREAHAADALQEELARRAERADRPQHHRPVLHGRAAVGNVDRDPDHRIVDGEARYRPAASLRRGADEIGTGVWRSVRASIRPINRSSSTP